MNVNTNKLIPHNKPFVGNEEINAIVDTLNNLELTVGKKVEDFENAFSRYIGLKTAATSSGTSALHLALIALGIKNNDEVIIPAYTCITVALPILYQQAKPILVEINDDYNISIDDIKNKITKNTKAIIVPHMFGYPADLNELKEIAKENNIYLIEDCAQSIGAEYEDKKVGTIGDISVFSFYATKVITSIQGGMVCSRNKDWIETIKDLREPDQYRSLDYEFDDRLKFRYTMSDVNAAMGIVQLSKLEYFISRRREISSIYRTNLKDIIHPLEKRGRKHIYSRYIIKSSLNPEFLIKELHKQNINCTMMHVPPLYKRAMIHKYNIDVDFLRTENIVNSSLSLPIYTSMTDSDVLYVSNSLNKIIGSI